MSLRRPSTTPWIGGWQAAVSNVTKWHSLAYYAVNYAHPTLVSDLVHQARVQTAEALRSACACGTVAAVDPRQTAQTCPCCGHQARNNRRSRRRFGCRSCGFERHADLNAASNIAATYPASLGRAETGWRPGNAPIIAGCLSAPLGAAGGASNKPLTLVGGY